MLVASGDEASRASIVTRALKREKRRLGPLEDIDWRARFIWPRATRFVRRCLGSGCGGSAYPARYGIHQIAPQPKRNAADITSAPRCIPQRVQKTLKATIGGGAFSMGQGDGDPVLMTKLVSTLDAAVATSRFDAHFVSDPGKQ